MDEVWEEAVETALNGEKDCTTARTLTLDGAVKCFHGRLPPPDILEKFQSLEHLSIANIGVSSLQKFPHLPKLQKLILSDNRISGGLEFLVEAGLESLRDLDLSNNRIQFIEDLAPLARLKLVSLDLYECPVTKIENYRSRVFGLIRSLKYLDKMDADENERLEESEEEEEDDDDEEDEEDDEEEDPGSGEIDGETSKTRSNGGGVDGEGVLDVDEDEESDADEEEREIDDIIPNGSVPTAVANGFEVRASLSDEDEEDEEDVEYMGEEIDEQEGEEEDVVEVQGIDNSDADDDVEEIDEDEHDSGDDDDDDDVEEVNDDEEDLELVSTGGRGVTSTDGEIDGHDRGEDHGEEDENGEIGEEEELNSEDDSESEDGTEFLVQPIGQAEEEDVGGSDFDVGDEDDGSGEEEEIDDEGVQNAQLQSGPSASSQSKRKRYEDADVDSGEEEEDDNEGVQNGDIQSNPSTSSCHKKKRNGEDDDSSAEEDDDISVDAKFRGSH